MNIQTDFTAADLLSAAQGMKDWLVRIRRSLHAIPEAGDAEFKTQDEICRVLESLKIPYERKGTSVVALVEGRKPGRVVALRADMDALPVDEPEDRAYASRHRGFMHACGHDAHMAIALGAARYFSGRRGDFTGAVKFLFQPAEETTGGAERMIAEGCLERPRVDYVIGLHVMPDVPLGKIEVKHGALYSSADLLNVSVRGKSAHAAHPETGVDAVLIAAKVVDALHSIVSRNVSPLEEAVLTIGTIHGGSQNNIVADEVSMTGIIRTTDPRVRAEIAERVYKIAQRVPEAFGGKGEAEIKAGYIALVNHDRVVDLIVEEAKSLLGEGAVLWRKKPNMVVEDFAFFLRERPGAFYHLGCGNAAKGIAAPLHARDFDIDEDCLPIGAALQAASALRLLNIES